MSGFGPDAFESDDRAAGVTAGVGIEKSMAEE